MLIIVLALSVISRKNLLDQNYLNMLKHPKLTQPEISDIVQPQTVVLSFLFVIRWYQMTELSSEGAQSSGSTQQQN